MDHLHQRSRHALMIGVLSLGVALVACQPADTAPTSTPSAVVSSDTRIIPTAVSPSAPVAILTVVDATIAPQFLNATYVPPSVPPPLRAVPAPTLAVPTPLPTAPPPPASIRTADQLPADQPWLLGDDKLHLCGTRSGVTSLIAVDPAGRLTQLNRGITTIAKRPGLPPLLMTCATDGTSVIVDPVHWTSVRLTLDPGFAINQFVVSPDGRQAILESICSWGSPCAYKSNSAALSQIIDLQTGAIRLISAAQPRADWPRNYMLGWGHSGVYHDSVERTIGNSLYLDDLSYQPGSGRELGQDISYILDSAHDRVILTPGSTSLILYDVRQGTSQTLEQAVSVSMPAFSPDGSAVAYLRADQDLSSGASVVTPPHVELVVVDIARNTKTVIAHILGSPLATTSGGFLIPVVIWSQDSQRIVIVGTESPQAVPQATILTRDGILLNTVPLMDGEVLGITSDDQLVQRLENGYSGVSWVPLRAGAVPYAPDVITDASIYLVILPPLGRSAPPAPTSAAPLPVTQLPASIFGSPTSTPMPTPTPFRVPH